MKITIIGTGYVGLVTGTCFAELGNEVRGIDINAGKIQKLQAGHIPIYEPGLEELVHRNQKENRLTFTSDVMEGIRWADVVFSAVGTPANADHAADLSAVYAVGETFGKVVEKYTVFVNKSTIPVGTTKIVKALIVKQLLQRDKTQTEGMTLFDIVSNPEFLREGSAVKDFMNPDRIIVGVDSPQARELMEQLYRPMVRHHPLMFTDIRSAEIIKYASNAFLATKISFINEMARFCEVAEGNVREVARGIGLDCRIGERFLHAGIGYGGSCFPKDVKALIQTGKEKGYPFKILGAVEQVNEEQKRFLFEKVKRFYGDLKDKTLAVWGLAFKPKTDDMREAPSLTLLPLLQEAGIALRVFDPVAADNAKKILGEENITYCENALESLTDADGLLVLTEWDEFRAVNLGEVKKRLKTPVIFDGRNIYDPETVSSQGLTYVGVGTSYTVLS